VIIANNVLDNKYAYISFVETQNPSMALAITGPSETSIHRAINSGHLDKCILHTVDVLGKKEVMLQKIFTNLTIAKASG
jgi:hypothetical protein